MDDIGFTEAEKRRLLRRGGDDAGARRASQHKRSQPRQEKQAPRSRHSSGTASGATDPSKVNPGAYLGRKKQEQQEQQRRRQQRRQQQAQPDGLVQAEEGKEASGSHCVDSQSHGGHDGTPASQEGGQQLKEEAGQPQEQRQMQEQPEQQPAQAEEHEREQQPQVQHGVGAGKNGADYELRDSSEALALTIAEVERRKREMEEANKKRQLHLLQTINSRKKRAMSEAAKLNKVQQELDSFDKSLSTDVALLRRKIEDACKGFNQAKQRFEAAEREYVDAKIDFQKKRELKDQLTEHLFIIIQKTEERKAAKLEELIRRVAEAEGADAALVSAATAPAAAKGTATAASASASAATAAAAVAAAKDAGMQAKASRDSDQSQGDDGEVSTARSTHKA